MSTRSTFLQLKENERAYRRDIILDASMNLFSRYSFHEIGMRDIADEAGISPASIYRYFSSRDDILVEILEQEVKNGRERQWKRVDGGASFQDIALGIVDFFWERESTLQMVGHFLWNRDADEEAKQKFRSIQQSYLDEFDRVLIQTGCPEENVRVLSKSFFASLFGIIVFFRNFPEGRDASESYASLQRMARLTAEIFSKAATEQGAT